MVPAAKQRVRPVVDPLLGRDILGAAVAYGATPDQDDDLQRQGDGGNGVVDPRFVRYIPGLIRCQGRFGPDAD